MCFTFCTRSERVALWVKAMDYAESNLGINLLPLDGGSGGYKVDTGFNSKNQYSRAQD